MLISLKARFLALVVLALAQRESLPVTLQNQSAEPTAQILEREALRRDAYTRLDSAAVAALLIADYLAPGAESPCCFHDRAAAIRRLAWREARMLLHHTLRDPGAPDETT